MLRLMRMSFSKPEVSKQSNSAKSLCFLGSSSRKSQFFSSKHCRLRDMQSRAKANDRLRTGTAVGKIMGLPAVDLVCSCSGLCKLKDGVSSGPHL